MSSVRAAASEATEPERGAGGGERAGAGAGRGGAGSLPRQRSFVTAAALTTRVPVAGAASCAAAYSRDGGHAPHPAGPDFGPNVHFFCQDTPTEQIQHALDAAAAAQVPAGFGAGRHAFFFEPGSYDVDARLGYGTSIAGLGAHPDDVIINGEVLVEGEDPSGGDSALAGCWRSAENLTVGPATAPRRRRRPRSAPPVSPAPPGSPYATSATSPLSREKPFLYLDEGGRYRVFLPGLRHEGASASWATRAAAQGSSAPIERFFIARPGDSVRAVNKALSQGKHLLLTPGVYRLTDTIRVKWAGTVVLGLGYAALNPRYGVVPMTVADARGVRIAGLLFDAGPVDSPVLLEIGARRGGRSDPRDPASVQDVFFRMGGAGPGKGTTALVVNSDNVLLDHIWAWRGRPRHRGRLEGRRRGDRRGRPRFQRPDDRPVLGAAAALRVRGAVLFRPRGGARSGVVAAGLHAVAADGHGAPAGAVGVTAVQQEEPAVGVGAGAQPAGGLAAQFVPGQNGTHGEAGVVVRDELPVQGVLAHPRHAVGSLQHLGEAGGGGPAAYDVVQQVAGAQDTAQFRGGAGAAVLAQPAGAFRRVRQGVLLHPFDHGPGVEQCHDDVLVVHRASTL